MGCEAGDAAHHATVPDAGSAEPDAGHGGAASISDPASAYVHVSEAHTTHIWIDIFVCM